MADPTKGDGAGLSIDTLNELADSFRTISEIFHRMAVEHKPKKRHRPADDSGNGGTQPSTPHEILA